ncbi:hypothetical protein ABW21_db0202664 [Orbilia brochopaga]|nr:hypothetical protein ABW21_db0202664 [Drechslerella brochopaga]
MRHADELLGKTKDSTAAVMVPPLRSLKCPFGRLGDLLLSGMDGWCSATSSIIIVLTPPACASELLSLLRRGSSIFHDEDYKILWTATGKAADFVADSSETG